LIDTALASGDHGVLGSRLRQQKGCREIERDDLVPRLARVILGRGAPVRARIVHQNVEPSVARQHGFNRRRWRVWLSEVNRQSRSGDVTCSEKRDGCVELALLARRQHQCGAEFAERFGDLQAEPA
jgi:hypothetical protein